MAAFTTIDDAGSFFSPTLYAGNGTAYGSGGNAITGVGFQPDFTWIKSRTTAEEHVLTDAVRGVTKIIRTTGTYAESTAAEGLNVFGSDGFTIGSSDQFNTNTEDYVSWNWKMGTTSGIGSGDITPTGYSFNTTSGFSVVAYTGTLSGSGTATVPHGLGIAPKMVITKELNGTSAWYVQHAELSTPSYRLYLNDTSAQADGSGNGVMSAPTSVVFDTNWGGGLNESGQTYIAYCFAPVQGFSAFGEFKGNGNADGPFIYTGFRPAFLLIKIYSGSGTGVWTIIDNKRDGYNYANPFLKADQSSTENATGTVDLVSTGFKLRSSEFQTNADGKSILYAAFAESPFVNSSSVPTNAR